VHCGAAELSPKLDPMAVFPDFAIGGDQRASRRRKLAAIPTPSGPGLTTAGERPCLLPGKGSGASVRSPGNH
jgi:hypothetical protein